DPEIVLARVKNALKDMPVLSIRINEQSDKDYYIVKIIMNAKGHDHADLKSEALKRLIKIHKELKETNSC
ncbi:MAG: mechanosensitive ion channel family protein, partial [archaeon YNP-LCB-003-016]